MGLHDDAVMVLSPGTKDLAINILLWGGIIEAAATMNNVTVVATRHPGDGNDPASYGSLVKWGGRFSIVDSLSTE